MRHILCATFLFLTCLSSVDAASCRASTAAQAGSQAGYNRAKLAADAWALRQNNISASLGECLGNISTTIIAPAFPDLADILNQIGQKICKAARDKINSYVPSTIDPWGDMPSITGLSSYRVSVPAPRSQPVTPTPVAVPPSPDTTDESNTPFISLN